jgi:hypothetical protein
VGLLGTSWQAIAPCGDIEASPLCGNRPVIDIFFFSLQIYNLFIYKYTLRNLEELKEKYEYRNSG